jgi:hypothetical protein
LLSRSLAYTVLEQFVVEVGELFRIIFNRNSIDKERCTKAPRASVRTNEDAVASASVSLEGVDAGDCSRFLFEERPDPDKSGSYLFYPDASARSAR